MASSHRFEPPIAPLPISLPPLQMLLKTEFVTLLRDKIKETLSTELRVNFSDRLEVAVKKVRPTPIGVPPPPLAARPDNAGGGSQPRISNADPRCSECLFWSAVAGGLGWRWVAHGAVPDGTAVRAQAVEQEHARHRANRAAVVIE